MSIEAAMQRWRDASHAFLLAALLVAVLSVTGSVFTLTFFVRQLEATTAQVPIEEEESIPIAEPPPPPPPPGKEFNVAPIPAGEAEPVPGSVSPIEGGVEPTPSPPGGTPSPGITPPPGVTPPPSFPPSGGSPPPGPEDIPSFLTPTKPITLTPLATAPTAFATPPAGFLPPPGDGSRAVTVAALVAVAVTTPMAAGTALVAVTALPGGSAGLPGSFLPFLAWVRPRRRPWGRVVEERTNLPVAGAVVTILDASGRPKESVSSRSDGTFAALLPRGTYQFSVQHPRFTFASGPEGITLFPEEQLYRGGSLDIKGEEGTAPLTPLVIGVRPTQPRRVRLGERFRSRFERLRVAHAQLAIPIILAGAAINSVALWMNPTPLLVSYEILYGVFLTFELLLSRVARRTLGKVRDAVAKGPVGLAIVRLMDMKTHRLVATRVTTPRGSFLLMPPPGHYRVQVSHAAYAPYTSDSLRIGRGGAGTVRLKVDLVPGETQSARAI